MQSRLSINCEIRKAALEVFMTEPYSWIDGEWISGNPPIIGPLTNAAWMATVVFDGARAYDGLAPDLDLHAERCIASALALGLEPQVTAKEIQRLAVDGLSHFPSGAAVYIRPMFYGDEGWLIPTTTKFCLTLFELPMNSPDKGLSICRTTRVRPTPLAAPTDAKAACLYPNAHRMLKEAISRGFDAAVVGDANGNVAELTTSNIFLVKDDVVSTPVPNGTFLNGITRQRTIKLLLEAGIKVEERTIDFSELDTADELFSTGNANKIQPISRYEDRSFQPGPTALKAQRLYRTYAEAHGKLVNFC
jgi:branched-chain amino acid aminotransferase